MTSEDVTAPNLNFIEDDLAAAVDEDPLDDGELYQDDDDNNLFSDSRHPPKGKYTFVSRHPDHQETIPSKLSLQGVSTVNFNSLLIFHGGKPNTSYTLPLPQNFGGLDTPSSSCHSWDLPIFTQCGSTCQ